MCLGWLVLFVCLVGSRFVMCGKEISKSEAVPVYKNVLDRETD
jgi:hypothetical protein